MATNSANVTIRFSGRTGELQRALQTVRRELDGVTTRINNINSRSASMTRRITMAWRQFSGVLRTTNNLWLEATNALRLVSQGMMSVGRAATFFISLPLIAMLGSAARVAIDFDEAMVRVSKTTGFVGAQLEIVRQGIRDIAVSSATSTGELASMAEQIGQLGVKSPEAVNALVRIFDMFATTTDVTSDKVASTVGRIANAFGMDLNNSADEVFRLLSVINKLENDTAASADQIVAALFKLAPVANMLDITAVDAAALGAALVAVGVDSSAAGTQLSRMFTMLTTHQGEFQKVMVATDKYADAQAVTNAINEDAVAVIFDYIVALEAGDNAAMALAETAGIFGQIGLRAVGAMASDAEGLAEALNLARREFVEAQSLIEEYNLAMESTANQMRVVRNNINDVALSFEQALLPIVNEVLILLIPLLRDLSAWITALPQETKMLIVAGLGLIAVFGPIVFFTSQIVFGASLMLMSIGRLVNLFIGFGNVLTMILPMLAGMGPTLLLIAGAALVAAPLILKFLEGMGLDVAEFFFSLADRSIAWGARLAEQFSLGLVEGAANAVAAALTWIGELIAGFLRSASPPKEGPLKGIAQWGKRLMDTYLQAFALADFSVLRDVGRRIGSILKNLSITGAIGEDDQFIFLADAREKLSEFIKIWRETGEIATGVLDEVTAKLGEAGDEIQALILLNLEYIEIQDRLAAIERMREDLIESYEDEIDAIAVTNASAEERVELIRRAMRERDQALRDLDEEEATLEDERDAIKEQLDLQKALIDAMQEQDNILANLLKALEKMAGAGGGGFELPAVDPDSLGLADAIEEALEGIDFKLALEDKVGEARGVWNALMLGLQGEDLSMEDVMGLGDSVGLGMKFNEFGQTINGFVEGIKEDFDTMSTSVSDAGDSFRTFIDENEPLIDLLGGIAAGLATFVILTKVVGVITAVAAGVGILAGNLSVLSLLFTGGAGIMNIPGVLVLLLGPVGALIAGIALLVGVVVAFGDEAWTAFTQLLFIIGFYFDQFAEKVRTWTDDVAAKVEQAWIDIVTWLVTKGEEAGTAVGTWLATTWENIQTTWDDIVSKIETAWDDIVTRFETAWTDLDTWLANAITAFLEFGEDILEALANGFDAGKTWLFDTIQGIVDEVTRIFKPAIDFIKMILDFVKNPPSLPQINIPGITNTGDDDPGLAAGGIVTRATRLIAGEAGAEAIIPLNQLPTIMNEAVGGGAIHVHFNNPIVRSDEDMKNLIAAVEKVLGEKIRNQSSFGGSLYF